MPIVFDHPTALLLLFLIVPFMLIGMKAVQGMGSFRRRLILGFRAILIVCLAVALADPKVVLPTDKLTTLYVVDVSASVRQFAQPSTENISQLAEMRTWIDNTSEDRPPLDRVGVVAFQDKPKLVHMHTVGPLNDLVLEGTGASGTNISDALQLASGLLPPDTLGRLVLLSDGNETAGDALSVAHSIVANSDLRIDVVPLRYAIKGETYVASLEAPAIARPGQTIALRVVIESADPMTGQLVLSNGGQRVDLNEDPQQFGLPIEVPAGRSVHVISAAIAPTPINRFEISFLPDGPDLVTANNTASTVVATPTRGRMLIVAQDVVLQNTLDFADLPVMTIPPDRLTTDLLLLQTYDLIVLDNIPASAISLLQQERLRTYVEEFGGGLLMIGGRLSFGPGGWNNTPLEALLPVELDPPAELRRSTGALVLVLDKSGSMKRPVGGALASQQQVANESAALAIESLLSGSWVGAVAFDEQAYEVLPMTRKDDEANLGGPIRGIQTGGGTRLAPALRLAQKMLLPIDVPEKHIVLLTDGRTDEANLQLIAQDIAEQGISLTTIAVGDEADHRALQGLAKIGGGVFHDVRNPRLLPRVLIDSVQVINTPLIKETELSVVPRPTGSPLAASMSSAPTISGSIITSPADDPAVQIDLVDSDGDPLLAHRQFGMGRVGVFMSDSGQEWTNAWPTWQGGPLFWAQLTRYLARAPAIEDLELVTRVDGETLYVDLQAMDENGDWLDYLTSTATVRGPGGSKRRMNLTQTAPGRYQGNIQLNKSGDYVLVIAARHGTRSLAPVITGVNIPAAAEYRFQRSNDDLLTKIAAAGKGRILELNAPTAANVFSKADLPERASLSSLWPVLAWICLALLLLDVAVRRLVLMPNATTQATNASTSSRALGAMRMRQVKRSKGSPATAVRPEDESLTPTFDPLPLNQPGLQKVESISSSAPAVDKLSEEELHAAIDKLLGKKSSANKPSASEPPPETPPENTDGSESTLDALRRARMNRQKDVD